MCGGQGGLHPLWRWQLSLVPWPLCLTELSEYLDISDITLGCLYSVFILYVLGKDKLEEVSQQNTLG